MIRRLYAGSATDLLSPQQVRHLFPSPPTDTLQLHRGDTMYHSSPTSAIDLSRAEIMPILRKLATEDIQSWIRPVAWWLLCL